MAYVLAAAPAFAHADPTLNSSNWAGAWSWEPGIVASLFFAGALYALGMFVLHAHPGMRAKLRREAFYFWTGWIVLAVALVSPIHPLGQELFSVHMVQHELLMVAAAPLLVLGRPARVWLCALPRAAARALGRVMRAWQQSGVGRTASSPLVAFLAHAAALWIWHVPRFFESTLDNDTLHAFQHACFLGTALWFWDTAFFGPRRRAGYGMAVVYLFVTALHSSALGALITFARMPWYPHYAATAPAWGYAPLEDQQLGGLIMWVPAGLAYIIAALALFGAWLRECERTSSVARLRRHRAGGPRLHQSKPGDTLATSVKCAPSA